MEVELEAEPSLLAENACFKRLVMTFWAMG